MGHFSSEKSKRCEQHIFHEKHMSFWWLLLFKFCRSFKWIQTSSICLSLLFSEPRESFTVSKQLKYWSSPIIPNPQQTKKQEATVCVSILLLKSHKSCKNLMGKKIISIMYSSSLNLHLPHITLSYKKGNILAFFRYSKTSRSCFLYAGIALQGAFVLLC